MRAVQREDHSALTVLREVLERVVLVDQSGKESDDGSCAPGMLTTGKWVERGLKDLYTALSTP